MLPTALAGHIAALAAHRPDRWNFDGLGGGRRRNESATDEIRLPSIDLPLQSAPPFEKYGGGADRTALTLFAIYHGSSGRSNKSQILITFSEMIFTGTTSGARQT